jgi:hypothetical protein
MPLRYVVCSSRAKQRCLHRQMQRAGRYPRTGSLRPASRFVHRRVALARYAAPMDEDDCPIVGRPLLPDPLRNRSMTILVAKRSK